MTTLSPDTIDLTDCDREPIHIPGAVQSHGVLLGVRPDSMEICLASENVESWWGRSAQSLVGQPLRTIMPDSDYERFEQTVDIHQSRFANPLVISTTTDKGVLNGISHWNSGLVVLELEPVDIAGVEQAQPTDEQARRVNSEAVDRLFHLTMRPTMLAAQAHTVEDYADIVCRELHTFLGFDRTMVYRFAPNGDGEVIAERVHPDMEPYLGLRYPASDIPKQARELYRIQWLRQVVDVDAPSARIHPAKNPQTGQPLDLSQSVLRAASPIHLQYLRNMGVASTITISLIHQDRLWGLLVCHNKTPKYVPYPMRSACELLAATVSPQFVSKEISSQSQRRMKRREMLNPAVRGFTASSRVTESCRQQFPILKDIFEADGVAIVEGNEVYCEGITPEPGLIPSIIADLSPDAESGIASSENWARRMDQPESSVAGVLLIELREDLVFLAFRKPLTQVVRWGGDPAKAVQKIEGSARLAPRASFEEFLETVRGTSKPWTMTDLELAEDFQQAVMQFVIKRLETQAAEARVREKLKSDLRLSEVKLALAFDAANIGFWEYDISYNQMTSTHWLSTLGYDEEDDVKFERFTELCHPEDLPRVQEALEAYLAGDAPTYQQQFRMKRREGRWVWVESRGRIVERTESGEPSRIAGVHLDIDALKTSQERVITKNDELQSFIYAVSHDLKSPLVTCRGFLGLLREDLDSGDREAAEDDLRRMEDSIHTMSAVIDDLLDLGRLGRDGVNMERTNLRAVIEQVAESLEEDAGHREATILIGDVCDSAVIDMHASRRIIQNLLENAIKHACKEPGCEIKVSAAIENDILLLSVSDTGPGIRVDFHQKIFGLFERLDSSTPGTGIGLASVAKAAELQGGTAWVESEPGQGATFYVRIPQH